MSFRHYRLLMWKNFHLKLNHWFISTFEFLLPIGVIVLLLKYVKPGEHTKLQIFPSPVRSYSRIFSNLNMELCYSPPTAIINTFMNGLKIDKSLKITPLSNEKELDHYISNSNRNDLVGIKFRNFQLNASRPNKFSYVLKHLISDIRFNGYLMKGQLLLSRNFINYVRWGDEKMLEQLDIQQTPLIVRVVKSEIMIPYFIVIVVIFIFSISLMGDILEEKNSGIKELMKMTGVEELTIWLTWFFYALFGILISLTICTVLLEMYPLNDSGQCLFIHVPFGVLWLLFILYCMANISFCFMISSIFQNNTVVTIVFTLYYILLSFGLTYITPYVTPYLLCLLPLISFKMGFAEVNEIESNGINFTWSIFSNTQNEEYSFPFGLLFIFCLLIADTLLYLLLAYYITNINPGKFGTRKSPFFLFQRIFSRNADNEDLSMPIPNNEEDLRYFEPPPSNLVPSIQLVNLHKRYKSLHAVRGVNLVIFEGEITVILGHNGAGKTTIISILTGLISPSSGYVYYNGMDVSKNMDNYRSRIGLCPQENRTFPYLSVMNHLLFFGQLKGATKEQATVEAEEYLNMVGMESKKKFKVNQLSSGMKRKLCLCIAMMGKTEVLILDEPSSGMDTESRRSLWNLLLKLRKERSMILTTHYMEEADALGDRIAIMNHGIIVCYGTSMFLKKAYETGYELTITKSIDNSASITQLIQNALPTASVVSDTSQEIVYKLPLTETHVFPALFRSLESEMMQLGVENMGVTATTMKQVFFKAGGVIAYDPKSPKTIINDAGYDKVTGLGLVFQQLLAIFKKKILFTGRDLMGLFSRLFLPTIVACLILFATNIPIIPPDTPVDLTLSSASPVGIVIYEEIKNSSLSLRVHLEEYVTEKGGIFMKGNGFGLNEELISLASKNIEKYHNFISGIEMNKTRIKLMYSHCPYCELISIDVYSNALLRMKTSSNQFSIETTFQPLPSSKPKYIGKGCVYHEQTTIQYSTWFTTLGFFTVDWLTYFAHFVSMERKNGFYHIQMMSRVSPFTYWLGTLLFDFIFFFFTLIIRMALFKIINSMDIIGFHKAFYVYLLMTTLFGICGLVFIYMLTFLINLADRSSSFFLIFNVSSVIISIFHIITLEGIIQNIPILIYSVQVLIYIIPFLTYYKMIDNLISLFMANSVCSYCLESYKPLCEVEMAELKQAYLEFPSKKNPSGMLSLLLHFLGQIAAYLFISFLMYSGILSRLFDLIKKLIFGTKSTSKDMGDSDVQQERNQVQKFRNLISTSGVDFNVFEGENEWIEEDMNLEPEEKEESESGYFFVTTQRRNSRLKRGRKMDYEYNYDNEYEDIEEEKFQKISLLVDGLHKNYYHSLKSFTAVSHVSFFVDRGTCFGLLGANGAGKSTTFKMLTAEILPTSGDAQINGYKLSKNKAQYLNLSGYCSQTDCFIEKLTGQEMLTMIASMRGVRGRNRKECVEDWVSIIGLEEYKNRMCGSYSGGNKRKLCSAMSLIGDPRVVFLDEPTSGVDLVSRHNLYDVMAQSKSSGQTVVLTSHSMEECETLCDKITIMVSGVMKCIGSTQHLKKRYAQGFSVLIKIFVTPVAQLKIFGLKKFILQNFNPSHIIMRDDRPGLLYYQITDTSILWSALFEKMENIKLRYQDVIQDYVITDTSLEEVFIYFAENH